MSAPSNYPRGYCSFCSTKLTHSRKGKPTKPSDQSKEHVYRASWTETLGHLDLKSSVVQSVRGEVFAERGPLAVGSLQAGTVCRGCNGGWMDALDHRVESIVLAGATNGAIPPIQYNDCFNLARWILKAACTALLTADARIHLIPPAILQRVREDSFLPDGFIAVMCRIPWLPANMSFGSVSAWPRLMGSQESWLKFGMVFNHFMIGCVWVDYPSPIYTVLPNYHEVFFCKRARVERAACLTPKQIPYPALYEDSPLGQWLGPIDARRSGEQRLRLSRPVVLPSMFEWKESPNEGLGQGGDQQRAFVIPEKAFYWLTLGAPG